MIRELLFMLNGQAGAVFVLKDDRFELCAGIAGLSPSEKECLKPLMKMGFNFVTLMKYVEDKKPDSFYLSVLKKSIAKSILNYQQTLVEMEDSVLDGALLGTAGVQSKVLSYTFLLEYLKEFVEVIKLQQHNCTIIDTVKQFRDCCGVLHVISVFQTIYDDCLRVLSKQLISWLLFGKLLDPHDEFFIVRDTDKHFVVLGERIPSCLTVDLVQQALFVGESVVSLSESQDLSEEDWVFIEKLQKIAFDDISEIILSCRDNMAQKLWKQVTDKGRLSRTLNMLNNTFLMKKGDVFAHFILHASIILDGEVIPTQLSSTQSALQQKLMNSFKRYSIDDEQEMERVSVKLDSHGQGQGWQRVSLEYRTEWPLGVLVFTPETMQTYNTIFRLLLKLRHIHSSLNSLWKLSGSNSQVWQLRWNFQHILVHLAQYISIDVIEVQKSIMERQMSKCQDFDNFRTAHAHFLTVVAAQTFLHIPPMQACFKDLMDLAAKFCCLLRTEDISAQQVSVLNDEFEKLVQLLLTLLNGMYQQTTSTSMEPIAQLLLRLDFNHFLTDGVQKK